MDRDFLADLFATFGPVTLRRMFSGYGVSVDGTNFALALRGSLYLRASDATVPQFVAEGSRPFQYEARGKLVTVGSYWEVPARLYDDPDEFGRWAHDALRAARTAAARKHPRAIRSRSGGKRSRAGKRPTRAQAT
jgi:DNA transformation protein